MDRNSVPKGDTLKCLFSCQLALAIGVVVSRLGGSYAFQSCSGLTGSLTIPNSVTSIGSYAFKSCSGLTGSLTISTSLTTIETRTFYLCSAKRGLPFLMI